MSAKRDVNRRRDLAVTARRDSKPRFPFSCFPDSLSLYFLRGFLVSRFNLRITLFS